MAANEYLQWLKAKMCLRNYGRFIARQSKLFCLRFIRYLNVLENA